MTSTVTARATLPAAASTTVETPRPLVVGLDAGHQTVVGAERWLCRLVDRLGNPSGTIACVHQIGQPYQHVVTSLRLPAGTEVGTCLLETAPALMLVHDGNPPPVPVVTGVMVAMVGAVLAARAATVRSSGSAVIFPGVGSLTGVLTVDEVLAASAIERITVAGGEPPRGDQLVDCRPDLRPMWRGGRLTLLTQPIHGGRLAPVDLMASFVTDTGYR